MGGDHHEPAFKVPDWRVMKVEGIGPLEDVQRALAAKGLKDPWLRNYVWRYPPEYPQSHFKRVVQNLTNGMKMGFGIFLVALSIKTTYQFLVPPKDHHHGHGEHH